MGPLSEWWIYILVAGAGLLCERRCRLERAAERCHVSTAYLTEQKTKNTLALFLEIASDLCGWSSGRDEWRHLFYKGDKRMF